MERLPGTDLTRRAFLGVAIGGPAILLLPFGCGNAPPSPGTAGSGRFLTASQHATLVALTTALIPEDQDPGAGSARVADYIDFLLGAFTVDPPRIHAAGPFSGRHGGDARFASYLPLSRVKEIGWRTYIEGSLGLAEREFNGPVRGQQAVYAEGLEALDELSRSRRGLDFKVLDPAARDEIVSGADPEFIGNVFRHAVEGMYAAPEYGGNADGVGWAYIGYEGDRQPVGYDRRSVEEP